MIQEYKQITELHIENSSLKNRVEDLEKQLQESKENFRRLERLYTYGTPTDGLEVGSPEDYEEKEKVTTRAMDEFLEGDIAWRELEDIEEDD